jgi:hypothetical protein
VSAADTSGSTWRIRGNPTDVEIAAVVTALTAAAAAAATLGGGQAPAQAGTLGGWSAHWRGHRAPVQVGPGAWQASGWTSG